jgi:acetolactate synthase-1/2/3 large subunit
MTGAQYIVESLISRGVTDAFGIPGGVILPLIYEMESRKPLFTPHLSYHEQCAGFAACGYAQASGNIGVAYATRGPGFTNMITAIADAYYDSLPTLFITAHSAPCPPKGMRVMADQEMDTCSMVRNITKMAVRLDDEATFAETINKALSVATEGRKGPVFLDIASALFKKEITGVVKEEKHIQAKEDYYKQIDDIAMAIRNAKCPIILAGDGVNQSNAREAFRQFVKKVNIPVVSSRFSHDLMAGEANYYGYVGGHGMRAANFILSKTDLILSLGNRLHFPPKSESYGRVMDHAKLLRVEVDKNEFNRDIQNTVNFHCDLSELLSQTLDVNSDFGIHDEWIKVCDILKTELKNEDINPAIESIITVLKQINKDTIVVADVGNNEFWVSRGAVESGCENRVLYSKSFGTLGCSLGKAIGAYYATKNPVVCFVGDQGAQMNIQELQFISQHQSQIMIVVLNNQSSGMIKDRESLVYNHYVHTTSDSGYQLPVLKDVAKAYGINYTSDMYQLNGFHHLKKPVMVEVSIDCSIGLTPNLPKGRKCQDMTPELPEEKYEYLNTL